MTTTEQKDLWESVTELKLHLVAHVKIHRHDYRGEPWYVLQDRASGRCYRFNAGCYNFISRLDGSRTIQQIWDTLQTIDEAPTQDDVVRLLAQLHEAEILQGGMPIDGTELFARRQQQLAKSRMRWLRPLSMRFPLADPDRVLTLLLPLYRPLFSKTAFIVWTLFVVTALMIGITHYPDLMTHWSSRALDPQNILMMFLVYPVIKALHELGHATATKVRGGEVHEMGIMLLAFIPMPFVDASASSAFGDKWHRIIVGAAGIMVEMLLAAAGMLVWLNVGPGLVRDVAFNVMFIGSVSTLLFNGNPLLRFDAYYVLMDAIEIPNLGQRSTRYLGYLVKRYLFSLRDETTPVTASGERAWFLFYGVAAFNYRIFISFAIALYVAGKFFVIGIILAIWALVAQIVVPLLKSFAFLLTGVSLQGHRIRAITITTIGVSIVTALVFLVPAPSWTQAEGILMLPDQSLIRAESDGIIVQLLAKDGESVHEGDALFKLEDALLPPQVTVLEWRLKELKARQTAELMQDRTQAAIYQDEISQVEAELAELSDQMKKQITRSLVDGTLVVSHEKDALGRFVKKGELLGYVINHSSVTAHVVIPQRAVDQVRSHTESVEVRQPHRPGESINGIIQRQVPLISDRLPRRALGTQGGGTIAVDARDSSGTQALEKIYQLDVALPPMVSNIHIGSKVYVRFNHPPEPLAWQWYRSLRQLFLARFAV